MVPSGGHPQSPFLSAPALSGEEPTSTEQMVGPLALYPPRSPFYSAFEAHGHDGSGAGAEEFGAFQAELYDHEFDEAVFELLSGASAIYEVRRLEHEAGGVSAKAADRVLQAHFTPLAREVDSLFEAVEGGVGAREVTTLGEEELEALFDRYEPRGLEPNFEFFFGRLKKKLKKIAKKGLSLAKKGIAAVGKLGLKPILDKIKGLVRPLLERVLKAAIGKLPAALRPYAQKLQASFLRKLGAREAPEEDSGPDPAEIQREFDEVATEMLFAGEEVEQEMLVSAYAGPVAGEDPVEPLNQARARFAAGVAGLREGEDATPHVEQFIPAILPALKLGVKLAGRTRVVNFLAGLIGKLIHGIVGRQHTPALSRAIVDAGLRLIHLEATPDDELQVAGEAVAGTVEETVRRVAALPEHVLADERLLEGFVLEAFEGAAADLLPPVLPERTYEARPELRASGLGGAWVFQPLRASGKRYQEYTRAPEVVVTPQVARAVRSYGGTPLSSYLQQRFGLPPGRVVKARIHLYRAIPGTSLSRIAALEGRARGAAGPATADFHPLTPEAAGLLLREPGLGAAVAPEYLAGPERSAVGQRFYRLEIAGAPVPLVAGPPRRGAAPRSSEVGVTLDFPRSRIRVSLFLSEREAQRTASGLREPGGGGVVAARLQSMIGDGVARGLSGEAFGRVRVLLGGVDPARGGDAALRRLPGETRAALARTVAEWAGRGLGEGLAEQARQLVAATEEEADGATALVTLESPPGLAQLRSALAGGLVDTSADPLGEGRPETRLEILPGYHRA